MYRSLIRLHREKRGLIPGPSTLETDASPPGYRGSPTLRSLCCWVDSQLTVATVIVLVLVQSCLGISVVCPLAVVAVAVVVVVGGGGGGRRRRRCLLCRLFSVQATC